MGLARALAHDPQVLALDEPTIGLDHKQIREVRQLIKGLSGDHPIILSTHILPEAEQVCERVVIIREGRIVADDSAEILAAELEETQRPFVHLHSLVPDGVSVLSPLQRVADVKDMGDGKVEISREVGADRLAEVSALAVEGGWGLLELRAIAVTLENIFVQLTMKGGRNDTRSCTR